MKLVHVVGFIIKKFVTMHGHINLKKNADVMCLVNGVPMVTFSVPLHSEDSFDTQTP